MGKKFGAHVLSAIHDPSKMNKISMAHYNTFVNKFTARMLSETPKFEGNGEFVFRKKGSTVPNAMNILLQCRYHVDLQSCSPSRSPAVLADASKTQKISLKCLLFLFVMGNPSNHVWDVTALGLLLHYLCELCPGDHTVMIYVNLVKKAC